MNIEKIKDLVKLLDFVESDAIPPEQILDADTRFFKKSELKKTAMRKIINQLTTQAFHNGELVL